MNSAKEIFDNRFHHSRDEKSILEIMELYAQQFIDEIKTLKQSNSKMSDDWAKQVIDFVNTIKELESELLKAKELLNESYIYLDNELDAPVAIGKFRQRIYEYLMDSNKPTAPVEQTKKTEDI